MNKREWSCARGHLLLLLLYSSISLLLAAANPELIEERFIGWRGETHRVDGNISGLGERPQSRRQRIHAIAWKPRAFVYESLLTPEECDHLKRLAIPQMQRSAVVPTTPGESDIDPVRTSYGMFIRRNADEVVKRVEQKVAHWTHLPPIHQEDMQVLRYAFGQKYDAHFDSLEGDTPRLATVLLYLSDTEAGGETAFPQTTNQDWIDPPYAAKLPGPLSNCAAGHVAMRPKKGDALLFWSMKLDGKTEDPFSEHAGCPVTKGVKWTATIWIHTQPFQADTYGEQEEVVDPGLCTNNHKDCAQWAASGECTENADYMWKGSPGVCRKACKTCKACRSGDLRCYNANRRTAGFLELSAREHALLYG